MFATTSRSLSPHKPAVLATSLLVAFCFKAALCFTAALCLTTGCGEEKPATEDAAGAEDTQPDDAGTKDVEQAATGGKKILLFTKTAGFKHDSIPDAVAALEKAAKDYDWTITKTDDAADLAGDKLKDVDAVVFVSTTGDALDQAAQEGLEKFIKAGGGWAGIHSASDTEHDWPWFGGLVGAYFKQHTNAGTDGTAIVSDSAHPSTKHLPTSWNRKEEWYEFKANPRGKVHVLVSLDGGAMGHDHPHAWCHNYEGGRAFYTAGGHDKAAWSDADFLKHVAGGIDWAARGGADCSATVDNSFKTVELAKGLLKPMELDVAKDGRVVFCTKNGEIHLWDPASGKAAKIGSLDVETKHEDGLLGLALDPGFVENGHVWIYHSIKDPVENHLTRFTIKDGKFDAKSGVTALKIPVQRKICCHSAGSLQFGPKGALYLTVGDNTNPWEDSGYSPIDESADRKHFDAQRTSGNPDDLRGKILRIAPKSDGTYAIPSDNLYADGKGGKPEIFALGVRNPFRMAIDPKDGALYWGETGPDAKGESATQGPRGYDEINRATKAGNFGWPYCIADNKPYENYDFTTKKTSGKFDCAKLKNDSPNGSKKDLPAAEPAMIWYPYGKSTDFPAIPEQNGRTAMVGVVYRTNDGARAYPEYFDGKLIWWDWTRNRVWETTVDETNGKAVKINTFATGLEWASPIDMAVGADGAIYMLEWGKGGFNAKADGRLVRIEFSGK